MELFKIFGTIALNGQNQFNSDIDAATQKGSAFATKLTNGLKTVAKVGGAALTAVGTGMVWLSKQAIDSYGDYEQLVGGVETLFKDSADTVQGYAENAYKTAGLSANEYMETVTSFSASLLQSLGNDTAAAAEMADLAITDMSDNANKMGTDMTAIQNAYNGFAKQNYTMLDNLKLGYGGTKSEMERLLKTANEINERQGIITDYSIESYADIVSAIHVVQTEMGITGTTALEASTTIQGSISSMKSAWKNLLAGISDPDQDLGLLIDNMVETAGIALDNLAPRIINLLPRLTTAIGTLIKKLNKKLPGLIREMLPALLSGAVSLIAGVIAEIPSMLSAVWEAVQTTWETLKQEFPFVKDVEDVVQEIIRAIGFEGGGLGLIIDDLREIFENLSIAIQPVIDKFSDYLKNGELVEDITTLIDDAMTLLAGAFKDVKEIVGAIIDLLPEYCTNGELAADAMDVLEEAANKVHDAIDFVNTLLFQFSDWCSEHKETIQTIAIVIGAFATAWGLVNGAITLWNTIGAIATAVTTGLGAAVTFLTSPINLVIIAVGALIAIFVLLWNNCEGFRQFWIDLWEKIKESFARVVRDLKLKVDIIKQAFILAWSYIKTVWSAVDGFFKQRFESIKKTFSVVESVLSGDFEGAWKAIKEILSGWAEYFSGVWEDIQEVFATAIDVGKKIVDDIKEGISNKWNDLVSWFTGIWDSLFGNRTVNVSVNKSGGGGGGGRDTVNGSHASGLDFVPFDGYVAELHKGEMVVPAAEARALRSGYSGTQNVEMASLLKQILNAIEDSNRKETVLKINNREFGRAVRGAVNA